MPFRDKAVPGCAPQSAPRAAIGQKHFMHSVQTDDLPNGCGAVAEAVGVSEAGEVDTHWAMGVVRQLLEAAGRGGGAALVRQAGALVGGPATLLDPVTGRPLYATTPAPSPAAQRGGAGAVVRPVMAARLVVVPSAAMATEEVEWVIEVTVAAMRVRAHRAHELRHVRAHQHQVALDRLLHGDPTLTASLLQGRTRLEGAVTLLRVHQGASIPAARTLDRVVGEQGAPLCLLARHAHDLIVVIPRWPASPADDHGREVARWVERVAQQHALSLGRAETVPWPLVAAAYQEAATGDTRNGLGPLDLDQLLPAAAAHRWAHQVIAPLGHRDRELAELWLRCHGETTTVATAMGLSRTTLGSRIAHLATTLGVHLSPTVRAHLVIALRIARTSSPLSDTPPQAQAATRSPLTLLPPAPARQWATRLLNPLDDRVRYALWTWSEHLGRTRPAAQALGVHRSTLTSLLTTASDQLGVPLETARVRAQLRIALEATGGADTHTAPYQGGRILRPGQRRPLNRPGPGEPG